MRDISEVVRGRHSVNSLEALSPQIVRLAEAAGKVVLAEYDRPAVAVQSS